MKRPGNRLRVILVLAMLLLISGCSGGTEVDNPEWMNFESDAALKEYLVGQYAQGVLPIDVRAEFMDGGAKPGGDDGAGGSGSDYAPTNIQEAGVDEADKVKTDGASVFVAKPDGVDIVRADPAAAMHVAGKIPVTGTVDSIYLFGETLAILYTPDGGSGNPWTGGPGAGDGIIEIGMPCWLPVMAKTGILLADISTPEAPAIIKSIEAEGVLVSSRLTGGRLHVILQYMPDLPPIQIWHNGTDPGKSAAVEFNREKLKILSTDDLLPDVAQYDDKGNLLDQGMLVSAENTVAPTVPAGGSIVSILSIDLGDPALEFKTTGLVADIHHVYASAESLYLVSNIYNTVVEPQSDVKRDDFATRIFSFDLTAIPVEPQAEGSVAGQIINQFSLGEYQGVLRIATTTGNTWDGSAASHVFCLKPSGGRLDVIGRIADIAPGERLYAARFSGKRGFLVTFVEIDPLFTLDLSDPQHPAIAGELKIPGYSTYIHPLGENHLLTIGKNAQSDGSQVWYQGISLSIFDISDYAAPRLLHQEEIGDRGTESEALYDHRAFAFWPKTRLLALPISLYEHTDSPENPWDYGLQTFSGIYVYRVAVDSGFDPLGRIPVPADSENYGFMEWMRAIFINDEVFAVTPRSMTASSVDGIAPPFWEIDL